MDGQHRSQINFRQLFPANPSLAEDLCRLFMTHEIIQSNSNKTPTVATATTWPYVGTFTGKDMKPIASAAINIPSTSPLLEEFRSLGRDSEYCPDYLNTTHNNMGPGRPVFKKKPKKVGVKILECVFCKNNGETPSVYASHVLKDAETRKICCPVLRAYTCPLCGAKGDTAHTIKYCPQNQEEKDSALIRPEKSLYVVNLIRNSNGRCRIKLN